MRKSLCWDLGDPDPVRINPDHNHHVFLLFFLIFLLFNIYILFQHRWCGAPTPTHAILFCFVRADPSPTVPPAATGGSSEQTSLREEKKKTGAARRHGNGLFSVLDERVNGGSENA